MRKKKITKAEQWKYARGFFVDIILLIVDYVLKCDEELKESEVTDVRHKDDKQGI